MNSDVKKEENFRYVKKDVHCLESDLLNVLREKYNLYTRLKTGQLKETHLLKQIRYKVSRIKYDLSKILKLR